MSRRPGKARTRSTRGPSAEAPTVPRNIVPIAERRPKPDAIRRAAHAPSDDEVARGWLREALCRGEQLSETDIGTIEAAVALLAVDLGAVARAQAARRERVAPSLQRLREEILDSGGTRAQCRHAVVKIVNAVSTPLVEVVRLIADAAPHAGKRRSRLHAVLRHVEAEATGLKRDVVARYRREVLSQIDLLSRFSVLVRKHGLRALRRASKRPAGQSEPVRRLVDVFLEAGYSKRQAFIRTAEFLRRWDPVLYPALSAEHVRSRWRTPGRRSEST